jgi:tetratricopeptide (TPR) repeat protein
MDSESGVRRIDDAAEGGVHTRHSLHELAEIANVTPQRIRSWVRAGLIQPVEGTDDFGFHEVRLATVLTKLAENGIGTARLRAVQSQLKRRFPDLDEALSQLDLFAGLLVIRDEESRPTSPNGQRLLELLPQARTMSQPTVPLRPFDGPASDDLFGKAVALEQSGDLEGATQAYYECLLQEGPEPVACFNLANVLSASGHTEAAVERYRQAVELNPDYAVAWNNLGLVLAELGESEDALQAWQRAVDADPDLADGLFNLADAFQQAMRFDEARPLWTAYLRHDSQGEWHDYACVCLGRESAPPCRG